MDELEKEMKLSFIEEAGQLLEDAEQCFLDLESNKGDPKIIETIFRLAHNLKGTSRAVGFGDVAEFTHELENLLLKLKERALEVDDETVDLLLECNDHLKMMIAALRADLDATIDSRELTEKIVVKLSGGSLKGATAPVEAGPVDICLADTVPVEATPVAVERQDDGGIDELQGAAALRDEKSHAPARQGRAVKESAANAANADESIRVSLGRLEKLNDFIGELVILQTVLNQHCNEIPSDLMRKTIVQLGKLSKEIQGISMSLRMIPLKQTFARLQRTVRDTAKALDKSVELVITGEQTEVDKTVLEHLGDPLVHIIRNAIDHGLEATEERLASGKTGTGHIHLSAFHQGNHLVIEIRDDGRGIDPRRLLRKAIEKGLVAEGVEMSDSEATQLLFAPGFSTKEQVSEISGRGVGLDVVKTNVELLGGSVQLDSKLGEGSAFRVVLPLTLAIVEAMIVAVGDQRYAVPVSNVHETIRPRAEDVHVVTGRGEILVVRDQVMPLFRLRPLLRLRDKVASREASDSIAIIVNSRTKPFAMLVDDILRQQQIVIKPLGDEIRERQGLTGCAILGDGKPALILDLNDLVEQLGAAALRASANRPTGVGGGAGGERGVA